MTTYEFVFIQERTHVELSLLANSYAKQGFVISGDMQLIISPSGEQFYIVTMWRKAKGGK